MLQAASNHTSGKTWSTKSPPSLTATQSLRRPPVFHVSQLELSTPNTIPNRIQPPPPPVEVDDDIEYEIAEILDSKLDQRHKCKLLYLVLWAGYEGTDQEMDWLVATKLTHASKLVADFHSAHPSRPGPLSSLGIQV